MAMGCGKGSGRSNLKVGRGQAAKLTEPCRTLQHITLPGGDAGLVPLT